MFWCILKYGSFGTPSAVAIAFHQLSSSACILGSVSFRQSRGGGAICKRQGRRCVGSGLRGRVLFKRESRTRAVAGVTAHGKSPGCKNRVAFRLAGRTSTPSHNYLQERQPGEVPGCSLASLAFPFLSISLPRPSLPPYLPAPLPTYLGTTYLRLTND
jgi:hypothetical protein